MVTKITDGIKISVETLYQPEYSNPAGEHFMFAYQIRIDNLSDHSIQLLRRNWSIFDSNGTRREVEGEGVVGQQPIIEPGESHEYVSGCNLRTEFGAMSGFYQMQRLIDGRLFNVNIPEFQLFCPFKMN
ncbi:MAG TPA: Co2+/Mg2+ efflux protein ApaG [Anseongella sp.]